MAVLVARAQTVSRNRLRSYDASNGRVRYQLRVLDDVTQVDLQLDTEPLGGEDAVGAFTAASLFIDDRPDGHVVCWNPDSEAIGTIPPIAAAWVSAGMGRSLLPAMRVPSI
ncbi:MAG TPA: hypothetical protein VFP05_11395 [Thermomicrobiales bacterium]|nr:hypothetical protein [Thermomicrobiales bacterium]